MTGRGIDGQVSERCKAYRSMKKIIWVMEEERANMIDIQRKINAHGSMCALCMFSVEALKKNIDERIHQGSSVSSPSLILIDYEFIKEDSSLLPLLKSHSKLAGVPVFFLIGEEAPMLDEYYLQGAMDVLRRPVSNNGILRIERVAWQYEATKIYEKVFQKQVAQLEAAKEIQRLNEQLESRNEFLNRVFGKYFSDELLEMILGRPEGEFVGGDRRDIAVLVADLRGFSAISEELNPDGVTDLLNCFFGAMVDVISKYSGTVIEFMGDGILAVFGAPMKNERYKENAIAATIAMQNAMEDVNRVYQHKFVKHGEGQELEMGIGVHCGEAFVGNVGSEKMMRYNVIGRVVNECSRIEGCSTGGQVLASEDILQGLSCEVTVENKAHIAAKGISKLIHICEISGIKGEYHCHLTNYEKEEMYPLQNEVIFELFPIQNKLVIDKPIVVLVKEFEMHKALVEVIQNPECNMEKGTVALFSDVEVRLGKQEVATAFLGVYAKVIKMDGKRWTLRFTHWNREFRKFAIDIQLGEGAVMTGDMKQKEHGILVEEISIDKMEETVSHFKEQGRVSTLFFAKDGENLSLLFCSNDTAVRALEFMDYLVKDYAMVKGDGAVARAVLSPVFLKIMLSEMGADSIEGLLKKMVRQYYSDCYWIYAKEYAKNNHDKILNWPIYMKKQMPWAYVKTTDIMNAGTEFAMKSLENESDIVRKASDDLYIMIGCRGEIYYIERSKFERTYEPLEENLDVYTQMLDYLPEVKNIESGEYISLDELAHLCQPKKSKGIYATCLEGRTKVFSSYNQGEYFVGQKGDYLAVRQDDLTDIYIIQKEIFHDTYEEQ